MKIGCPCGAVVPDTTDFLPHKAHLVADEDWFDVLDAVAAGAGDALLNRASRGVWCCGSCGRLFVDGHDGTLRVFLPEGEHPPGLLRSHLLDRWRRPMAGTWHAGRGEVPGELWWGGSDAEQGFERFTRWADLERRYHEVFTRLRERDLLRSAFLRQEGVTVHRWPQEP